MNKTNKLRGKLFAVLGISGIGKTHIIGETAEDGDSKTDGCIDDLFPPELNISIFRESEVAGIQKGSLNLVYKPFINNNVMMLAMFTERMQSIIIPAYNAISNGTAAIAAPGFDYYSDRILMHPSCSGYFNSSKMKAHQIGWMNDFFKGQPRPDCIIHIKASEADHRHFIESRGRGNELSNTELMDSFKEQAVLFETICKEEADKDVHIIEVVNYKDAIVRELRMEIVDGVLGFLNQSKQ